MALGDAGGELAQGLTHEAGLHADRRLPHLAFEFGLGDQRGDGVDHDDIDGVGSHQHVGDLQRLLAAVGLADEECLRVDTTLLHPGGVEGVFGIDECRDAVVALGGRDDVQGERRLAARLGAEDLDDAAARHAEAAQGEVEREGPGADTIARCVGVAVHLHDRAFAVGPLDLLQRPIQCLFPFAFVLSRHRCLSPSERSQLFAVVSFAGGVLWPECRLPRFATRLAGRGAGPSPPAGVLFSQIIDGRQGEFLGKC